MLVGAINIEKERERERACIVWSVGGPQNLRSEIECEAHLVADDRCQIFVVRIFGKVMCVCL